MKDLHKNPVLYYIGIPVLVAVWPLLVWSHYLPRTYQNLETWKDWFPDVNALAVEILSLDPDRLADGTPIVTEQFDYLTAITRSARKSDIPPGGYSHSTGMITTSSKGQKSQTATVTLKAVSVVQACRFLSALEVSWPHLECTAIDLTQDKKVLDRWDAKLGFQYFYN